MTLLIILAAQQIHLHTKFFYVHNQLYIILTIYNNCSYSVSVSLSAECVLNILMFLTDIKQMQTTNLRIFFFNVIVNN